MVRLAIVRGLTYTDMAQIRNRWLIPTYATTFRWTGNSSDAEDLTAWIFHNLGIRSTELVQVVQERLAELTAEAIVRHWWERYGVSGVNLTASSLAESRPTLEDLMKDLTADMHLTLIRRFVRRRPIATIARQLGISVREADRQIFVALARVAQGIGLPATSSQRQDLDSVSTFVTDLLARRCPRRFEARPGTWPALVAACHLQAAIAGNDLPTQRFVRSLEPSTGRLVTELRIWTA